MWKKGMRHFKLLVTTGSLSLARSHTDAIFGELLLVP